MNTYYKFMPNVFLAKCEERHKKGDIIPVTTRRGSDNDSVVHNLIFERGGFFYYSITRADGFNAQERARRRAERFSGYAQSAESKGDAAWRASNKDAAFLSLGEPIKIGHHSEKRHRKIIEQARNNMDKFVEFGKIAEKHESKAEYWKSRENDINLSMPESVEYFRHLSEVLAQAHAELKSGKVAPRHSYSLTYAKKDLNDAIKKLNIALQLWGD